MALERVEAAVEEAAMELLGYPVAEFGLQSGLALELHASHFRVSCPSHQLRQPPRTPLACGRLEKVQVEEREESWEKHHHHQHVENGASPEMPGSSLDGRRVFFAILSPGADQDFSTVAPFRNRQWSSASRPVATFARQPLVMIHLQRGHAAWASRQQ
jgi:hypothetical protein